MLSPGEMAKVGAALDAMRSDVDLLDAQARDLSPLTRGETSASIRRLAESSRALLDALDAKFAAAVESQDAEHEVAIQIVDTVNRWRSRTVLADAAAAADAGNYATIVGKAAAETARDAARAAGGFMAVLPWAVGLGLGLFLFARFGGRRVAR